MDTNSRTVVADGNQSIASKAPCDLTPVAADGDDAMVCYCYRQSLRQIRAKHRECGSLAAMQEKTGIGNACGGCRVVLHSIFDETPSDINQIDAKPAVGTSCSKPGSRIMKGFIVADGELESTVYSSNAVAPQLGDCDSTIEVDYALLDHTGRPVFIRKAKLMSNEVFVFDTRKENLPRPFYGMFLYGIGRSNYGAARFNIYWSNGKSTTSTHENSDPGRPRVYLPITVTQKFLDGNTKIHLGLMNPHTERISFTIKVIELESGTEFAHESYLDPFASCWLKANEFLYAPALEKIPNGKFALKIESSNLNSRLSMVEYMFFYNKEIGVWTSNHL